MNLSQEDADLFYKLMFSLQCYINRKLRLVEGASTPSEVKVLQEDAKIRLRESVYQHPKLVTNYLLENPDQLDPESLDIVGSWVNFISGDFYIERYLKNHAIFMNNNNVYAVKALHDPFDLMIPKERLPVAVQAVLVPFKGQIIFDGLLFSNNIYFGSGIAARLKQTYLKAKQNERIISTFFPDSIKPEKKAAITPKRWTKEIAQLQKVADPLKGGAGQPALNSPAFSLIKNSIKLADQAASKPSDIDTLYETLKNIRRAVTQIENILQNTERS